MIDFLKRMKMAKRRDITGQIFGKWKVLKRTGYFTTKLGNKTSMALWLCQCECGTKAKVIMSNLTTGKTKNCRKCADVKTGKASRSSSIWESVFKRRISYRCTDRNIECTINVDDFKEIVEKPCYYCGKDPENIFSYKKTKRSDGEEIKFNGVDRLNSKLGYTKKNSVSCCYVCNIMKNILTNDDFLSQVEKIYNYQKQLTKQTNK